MKTLLITLMALSMTACGGLNREPDWASDGDEMRDRAMAFYLDATADDRIEASRGDNTDWKYIDIIDPGRLRVVARVDTPEQLEEGEVALYDKFGGVIERLMVERNQTNYVFSAQVKKAPTKYFVRVFARNGTSVYSVGASLQGPPKPAAPRPVAVAPAPVPPPVAAPRKRRRAPIKRRVRKVAPTPPPAPVAAPQRVAGRVVRVIPTDNPKRSVISIRLTADASVPKGAQGSVVKGGQRFPFRVTRARGRKITAAINTPPGKLTGNLTATITLK